MGIRIVKVLKDWGGSEAQSKCTTYFYHFVTCNKIYRQFKLMLLYLLITMIIKCYNLFYDL